MAGLIVSHEQHGGAVTPQNPLMTAATFRSPPPLLISVAEADRTCGGRVELGKARPGTTTSTSVRFAYVAQPFVSSREPGQCRRLALIGHALAVAPEWFRSAFVR